MTYIGNGMKIEGNIHSTGSIRIDGEVTGDIDCKEEISVGPTALIRARLTAVKMVVNGRVEGDVFTSDQLEVMSQGHIVGNVSTPAGHLIIHEGAIIEGQCVTYDSAQGPKKLLKDSKDVKDSKDNTLLLADNAPNSSSGSSGQNSGSKGGNGSRNKEKSA